MNEIVKHERWTKVEDLTLLTMHQSGQSILDIARELGKSFAATQTRVNRKGCGRSAATVRRGKWTAAEIDKVVELAEAGTSMAEIAGIIGRSELAVMAQAARSGVPSVADPKNWTTSKPVRMKSGNMTNYGSQGTTSKSKAIRVCMTCRGPFMSEWIGNRRCQPCKTRTASEGMDD
ncbi:hypothetical protein FOB41_15235 [Agrobacterium pusense]|uniref:Uncharacterized protein n=1 Tax=Agrobacterium pusense TaxID=648995 RepID=A0A6H0ZQA7_9HYPH|nr:hypothetical protein [Agrobacterium pusense]QIX22403.1 hypothetical protein FOB41_15235 [Agrobacterium pusense]